MYLSPRDHAREQAACNKIHARVCSNFLNTLDPHEADRAIQNLLASPMYITVISAKAREIASSCNQLE